MAAQYELLKELLNSGTKLSFGQDFFFKFYQAFLLKDRWMQYINGVGTTLLVTALALALGVVLGGLLSIPAMPLGSYTLKIGLGVLPVIVTAVLYGPLYGGTVGALTDLLQALIFPKGAYMPWFTVIGALFGVIPGIFFVKGQKPTLKRIFVAVFSGQTVCSVVLNTLLLMWLYGSPWQIVYARLINQAVMIPLYTALVYYVVKLMDKCGII
jgi:ECF transporter S component (folate family)